MRQKDPPGTVKKCRSCDAPIIWVTMVRSDGQAGAKNCIDADPTEDGTLEVRPGKRTGEWYAKHNKKAAVRYTSHFATCPNAAQHRGEKR